MQQQTLFGAEIEVAEFGALDKAPMPLWSGKSPYEPSSGDRVRITLDAVMVPTMKPAVNPEDGTVSLKATWTAIPIPATVSITETTTAKQAQEEWAA